MAATAFSDHRVIDLPARGEPGAWPRLKALLGQHLRISREHAQGFVASTADGPAVFVERAHGSASDWVVIRVKICVQSEMDPALVLERNGRLAFAVMVLVGGAYWLRVAIPVDSAELNDPWQLVQFLVDAARSLSPHRLAPANAIEPFQHYTE